MRDTGHRVSPRPAALLIAQAGAEQRARCCQVGRVAAALRTVNLPVVALITAGGTFRPAGQIPAVTVLPGGAALLQAALIAACHHPAPL
ncbi:TPA: hypothetical protein ON570_002115 [Citrobacter werkmanii]|nr:hypothetical protein [Citrobacter werkmanii]